MKRKLLADALSFAQLTGLARSDAAAATEPEEEAASAAAEGAASEAPPETPPEAAPDREARPDPENSPETATAEAGFDRKTAVEIARLCAEAGQPALAAELIAAGASTEEARARLDMTGAVRAIVAQGRKINPALPAGLADELLAAKASPDQARQAVFERLQALQSPEIDSHHAAARPTATIDTGEIYARWNSPKAR